MPLRLRASPGRPTLSRHRRMFDRSQQLPIRLQKPHRQLRMRLSRRIQKSTWQVWSLTQFLGTDGHCNTRGKLKTSKNKYFFQDKRNSSMKNSDPTRFPVARTSVVILMSVVDPRVPPSAKAENASTRLGDTHAGVEKVTRCLQVWQLATSNRAILPAVV